MTVDMTSYAKLIVLANLVPGASDLDLSKPKSTKVGTSPLVENVGHFFLVVQQVASSSKIKFNHLRRQLRLAIVLFLSKRKSQFLSFKHETTSPLSSPKLR